MRSGDLGQLNMADQIQAHMHQQGQDEFNFERWIKLSGTRMWPQLNPWLFANKEDEVYVITASLSKNFQGKIDWIHHFYGDRVKVFVVPAPTGLWGADYVDEVVRLKLNIIAKEGIKIYFDDDPAIVRVMREQAKLREVDVKAIRYGPWIDEVY